MARVLVTGVRGKTGVPLARRLTARGVDVLGGTSSADAEVEHGTAVRLSWDDPSGWPAATEGVDAVYVVRPDRADAPELVAALLEVVPPAARVVLLSEREAGYPDLDAWALRVESAVQRAGHAWTILRPSWFMQVLTDPRFFRDQVLDDGELPFPGGGASLAWIDADDIAAVAERALLDDGLAGAVLELSGPEALSLPRTAALLADALGRPVVHREVGTEDALAGLEGFERDLTAVTFARVRAGTFAGVTDVVERVTGRPARSLEEHLQTIA